MKTGHEPQKPACALGRIQVAQMDVEEVKREGWNRLGILVVAKDDGRLGWVEKELVRQIGEKLYGQRGARRE